MNEIVGISELTLRQKIFTAEAWMKQQPQLELETRHYFSKDVYAREILIPAGTILVGEIHKYENLNILSKGSMIVSTEDAIVKVDAPFTIVSPPGTKRIARALTDCVWTTIHGTDERNVDLIKQKFIATSEQEYLEFCNVNQLTLFG